MTPTVALAPAALADELTAISRSIAAEIKAPSGDRARLVGELGSRLMAMSETCVASERIEGLLEIGQLAYFEGRSEEGLASVKKGASLALRADARPLLRKAYNYEAALHQDLGDFPTVLESSAAAIALARELQQPREEAAQWGNLASLFVELGNFREALRAADRALVLDPDGGSAMLNAAEACLELGQLSKGLVYARRSVEINATRSELQYVAARANAEATWARLLLEVSATESAQQHIEAAVAAAQVAHARRARQPALVAEGLYRVLCNEVSEGLALLHEALEFQGEESGAQEGRRLAVRSLMRAYQWLGDRAASRTLLEQECQARLVSTRGKLAIAMRLSPASAVNGRATANDPTDVLVRFGTLAALIEERSGEHGIRTGRLAQLIAKEYGCSHETQNDVALAGLLHDIGKLAVIPSILSKEDSLGEEEIAVLRHHPEYGAQLLSGTAFASRPAIVAAVRHHHEQFDGDGFPFKLKGAAIPVEARIVGIAQAFDEMVHATPRRHEPLSVRRALEEMLRQRGRRFDPQLTDILVERVRRLQREEGDLDDCLSREAEASTLVRARRQLREMLDQPVEKAA
jgi:HD-GYP domain-containing protein (c-di-GMP phosphodiesterase class II)